MDGSTVTGATGASLTGDDFSKGQTVTVQATPSDGTSPGSPVTSSSVTVANTAPVLSSISLSPSTVYGHTAITASPTASDVDGDTLSYSFAWYHSDEGSGSPTLLSPTEGTLDSGFFDRNDVLHVVVTASDGDGTDTLDSDDIVVANTAPPAPSSVAFTPSEPENGDDLTCTTSPVVDPDGDAISYDFRLIRDDSEVAAGEQTTETFSVGSSETSVDDLWRCEVRSFDGDAYSAFTVSGEVEVKPPSTFTFTDTTSDDLEETALRDFFEGLGTVASTSFIFFEIDDGDANRTLDGAWCAERADWYVDTYVAKSVSSENISSGDWQKWSRDIGGSWSAATTQTHTNYFGTSCGSSEYDWCTEWRINGKRLAIMPGQPSSIGESYAAGWSNGGGWTTTIQVGKTREAACGF